MKKYWVAALGVLTLAACGERAGLPETETTGTAQAISQTTTASATTTGVTGGTSSAMAPEDKEFVSNAGMYGLAAVQMGNVGVQKASSANVKAFAQRTVADHAKANEELQQFATTKGVALPAELDSHRKGALDHLAGLSGMDFDKAFMQHMLEDHEKAVADFQKASTSAADTDLRAWAGKTLPALREHLNLARDVSARMR